MLIIAHWWESGPHVQGTPSHVQVNIFNVNNRTFVGVRGPRAGDSVTRFAAAAETAVEAASSWPAAAGATFTGFSAVEASKTSAETAARRCRASRPLADSDEALPLASWLPDLIIEHMQICEFAAFVSIAVDCTCNRSGNARV